MDNALKPISDKVETRLLKRAEPCRVCQFDNGYKIAEIDYWDLQNSLLIQCSSCGHIQLDPMLTETQTAIGCEAYYIQEMLAISGREQFRNLLRNFRRGVLFARDLQKQGIRPKQVLEFGPGTGYFLAGMQFIFSDLKVTVVDIVDDVLQRCQQDHGFQTLRGLPDDLNLALKGEFDLIIARDIMEHVSHIDRMVANVQRALKPGGYFHFITPNGYEDVWGHFVQWQKYQKPSELLINHVSYFEGRSLLKLLQAHRLQPVQYFAYHFKNWLKGKGWKMKLRWSKESQKKSAQQAVGNKNLIHTISFAKSDVLNQWYIRPRWKWLTVAYCWFQHAILFRLPATANLGHEIYGLFRKETY